MPVRLVAEELSRQVRVPVVVPGAIPRETRPGEPPEQRQSSPADQFVSLAFDGVEAEAAFRQLAATIGRVARYEDGVITFLAPGDVVEGFGVYRYGAVPKDEALEAVRKAAGKTAEVTAFDGRVLVAGDRSALERVGRFADQLEAGSDGWQLEVRVVRISDTLRRELGIDWSARASFAGGGDVGAGFGVDVPKPSASIVASALVQAVATAAENGSEARLLISSPLYVLEGRRSTLQQGDRVPVPKRTVSPEGTVTTVEFDFIDTGFTLDAAATRVPGGVLLEMSPAISAVAGSVEGVPIVTRSALTGAVVARSGDWILLGGLESLEGTKAQRGVPGLPGAFHSDRLDSTSILVFVRAVRVFAGGKEA